MRLAAIFRFIFPWLLMDPSHFSVFEGKKITHDFGSPFASASIFYETKQSAAPSSLYMQIISGHISVLAHIGGVTA